MGRIYLDYAATTPTHPDVLKALLPYFNEAFGNPSTIYSYGQEAKGEIEEARTKVASLIGARDEEIVFTLNGNRVHGTFSLIRFRKSGDRHWLLMRCSHQPD